MGGFRDRLQETAVILNDGAMGTQLQAAGLKPGECGDHWNLTHPDRVLRIHQAYLDAGSECITTNTFGACRLALDRHHLASETEAINRHAVRIAREAFADSGGFVLGNIGPFGGMLQPYGEAEPDEVFSSFREQAAYLLDEGANAIIIETMTALEELELAIRAAREAGAECLIASMAFDLTYDGTDARTMMGVSPEQAAELMQSSGADVAGINCGTGVDASFAARIIERFRASCDLPLIAQPNCGRPELEGDRIVYREKPVEMASRIPEIIHAGARLIGACCGSTPEHIRLIRRVLEERGI